MNDNSDIASLSLSVPALTPDTPVGKVGELFLSKDYERLLSLPVVDGGKPVGIVNRYHLMQIYMKLYGREVYGRRPVTEVMGTEPLIIDIEQPMEQASRYITQNIRFPITEDFIVTHEGRYAGMGMVLDLLKAMEHRIIVHSKELGRAYSRLKASQTQLVQSEKMASLGQMVAGVAHEINTPLGYVRNNIEVMRDVFSQTKLMLAGCGQLIEGLSSGNIDEAALENLLTRLTQLNQALREDALLDEIDGIIEDTTFGVDQISELVVDLKNFSRLDQAKTDDVDINECIESALNIGHNVIKHKAEIIKRLGELPRLTCSPSQLNQVFLNLLTNAAQAIEGFGKIVIESSADEDFVYVSIRDTGKGIEQHNLRKIFDPFFTTKPVGEGTGLGLSITYQIVRKHAGHIKVASQPGKGTRFSISLPRTDHSQLSKAS